jgi:hypothetical protein
MRFKGQAYLKLQLDAGRDIASKVNNPFKYANDQWTKYRVDTSTNSA